MGIDRARAEALFLAYGPVILRRCTRLLKNASEAEDATQEVFLKVCRYLARLPQDQSGLQWVHRIATTVCLNRLRGSARAERAAQRAVVAEPSLVLDDRRLAQQVLDRCDEQTALVACYHFIDGMTQEEVATTLGLSRRTVYSRLADFMAVAKGLA